MRDEYKVDYGFAPVPVVTARWIKCEDPKMLEQFRKKAREHLALDQAGELVYIAPTRVNLEMTRERWPEIRFHATREL